MSEDKLKDKIAIVTGAAQGLGEALAKRLVKEGASVAVCDMNIEKAETVAAAINNEFGKDRAIAIKVDVSDPVDAKKMVEETVKKYKRLDILVSNAGILKAYEITEFPDDVWKKVMEVNLFGYFLVAKEAAKVMKAQKSGVIIQINSKTGKKGSFWSSAYTATKFGGIGFTQSIALDLAPYGVRVNAICPGNLLDSPLWTDSLYEQYSKKWGISKEEVRKKYAEQVPLGRGCSYKDIENVMVFLASEDSSYMTGQALNVTGGQEMR